MQFQHPDMARPVMSDLPILVTKAPLMTLSQLVSASGYGTDCARAASDYAKIHFPSTELARVI